jgi:antitoxin (DNA-binding transcriptional repressor) of toxin-antitoxin stability system
MTELTAEEIGPDALAKLKAAAPGASILVTQDGQPLMRLVVYPGADMPLRGRGSTKWQSRRIADDLDALPGEFAERTA